MVGGGSCRAASEFVPEVVEVAIVRGCGLDLVDDRQDVVKAGDGCEGWRIGGAESSPGRGEDQGILDGLQVHPAVMEAASKPAIGSTDVAEGVGRVSIELEHTLDVALAL